MEYMITDLKMAESYGCITADSGKDALMEFAVRRGFLDLMEFVAARPTFANDLMAVQLQ